MLETIYIGMSGLMGFSKGLSNISNNVANLNTPGYKGSELEFLDLFYRYQYSGSQDQQSSPYAQGAGVQAGSTALRFTQGEFRQTGNDLDAAVDGNGMFVLSRSGQTSYTRDGEFKIDDQGFLAARSDGARVLGFSGGGLGEIDISGRRSTPPQPTRTVTFSDSLSTGSTTFEVANISVFDSLGAQHTLTLQLTNDSSNTPGRWTFVLKEGSNTVTNGEIRYAGSGTVVAGFERHTFNFAPTNGASPSTLTLDFAGTNAFSSSASSMKVASQDGRAAGFLTKTSIDTNGFLTLGYSNGESVKAGQLALAHFANPNVLQAQGNNRFTVFGDENRILGVAGSSGLGALKTGSIELSNVDLAQEFSELIIVQRGYQASSQVISAANEMIQQLGEIRGRK